MDALSNGDTLPFKTIELIQLTSPAAIGMKNEHSLSFLSYTTPV